MRIHSSNARVVDEVASSAACHREDGVTVSSVANLRGLPRPVVLELLGGLQRCAPVREGRPGLLRPIGSHGPHDTNRSLACTISTWTGSAKT